MSAASPYAGVRVLVLGGTGFIGRHVARALAQRGARVAIAARDAARGAAAARDLGAGIDAVPADLEQGDAVAGLLARVAPAIVFDLSGYGVDPRERDEATAQRMNADLPPRLAEALAKRDDRSWPGQRLVRAGTALEYGTAGGDLHEETVCTPTTVYGRTKLEGTRRLADAAARSGIRAVTARLFTVYGPGEHEGRLLPTLLAAARTIGPIPLTSGEQRRDFTFVEDVALGMLRLGALPAGMLGVVNLATGRLARVREFVETAADVLGIERSRLRFGELPTRREEMAHEPVNVGRLHGLLDWLPLATMAEGLSAAKAAARLYG